MDVGRRMRRPMIKWELGEGISRGIKERFSGGP